MKRGDMTSQMLISALLGGYVTNNRWCYLEENSPDEKSARTALAEMLRRGEPLPLDIRCSLADLLDPASVGNERKIKFVHRTRGRAPNKRFIKILIACHVQVVVDHGGTVAEGIRTAADKFHLSQDHVRGIWQEQKPLMGVLVSPNTRVV
jgi:hypothetical protein